MIETDILVVGSGTPPPTAPWNGRLPCHEDDPWWYQRDLPGARGHGHAWALADQEKPIPSLLATDSDMTGVLGGTFPGAGSTIGPALTFGYIAAQHAASASRSTSTPTKAA